MRHLKRLRSNALRAYCRNRCPFARHRFALASNGYRTYNRLLYKRHCIRTQANLRRNPRQFWNFVNTKRKESGLPTEMFLGNNTATTAPQKCELFATHFKSAFNETVSSAHQVAYACRDTPLNVCPLSSFTVTEELVRLAIRKLKYSVTPSLDGIPACVLKKCEDVLVSPLTTLFNLSFRQCRFPSSWKTSIMFPVHKKGNRNNVENYRGITSLCACSKVLEIIMNDALFASCKNYISSDQHGFFPKRSTSTNLVQFVSFCLRNMDAGAQVDTVYTDLKSAFDRVDHGILLERLKIIGVSADLVCWLGSYLRDRNLIVKIGCASSLPFSNASGVPQGSNLGPLLFSLFINELSFLLPPGCRLFYADDVKLYMVVKCVQDCLNLQQLLNAFDDWCTSNMLTISIPKCSIISYHRKHKPITHNYFIRDQPLERALQVRDLGVTLDSALTFQPHFNTIINKANRQLGFMLKISNEFNDPLCLRSLYCALVRSILESNSVVWCPYQSTWIARIEAVQRKFVRAALRHLPWRDPINLPHYEDRCRLLGLSTLENRRSVAQAVFIAKILLGESDSSALLSQLHIYAPERILRERNFLMLEQRNSLYGEHDPIRFMTTKFNEVYAVFDFNVSSTTFKNRLREWFR